MSWTLHNQVCENADAGFYKSPSDFAVMRALASFADDGGNCCQLLATLTTRSQCSQGTVQRVLKQFKERGWITVKATGRSNHYRILSHGRLVIADAPNLQSDLASCPASTYQSLWAIFSHNGGAQ